MNDSLTWTLLDVCDPCYIVQSTKLDFLSIVASLSETQD